MFKKLLPVLLVATTSVCAQTVPALDDAAQASPASVSTSSVLGAEKPLSTKQAQALALSQKWINGTAKPITAGDGTVTYYYGKAQPVVVCAPLQTCDIQLQPGERITKKGVNIGDSVRWEVSPALSGAGETQQTHLVIKPKDVGLDTSMTINTDRRSYSIRLVSRQSDYMPAVNFDYPEVEQSAWDAYYAEKQQETAQKTLGNGLNIDNLDFNYSIEGDADFKPVRVYNNGIKTFIELPHSVASNELPAVLVVNPESGEKEIVNYGFHDGKFVVDQLAKQLILVQGVGGDQASVLITREH